MAAADVSFLSKRFTGLVQLTYSLVIAYAMFLTLVEGDRDQIAMILLVFCLVIIAGCLLETYGGLRPISDRVREMLYDPGVVYDSDRRDEILYGRIRPKLKYGRLKLRFGQISSAAMNTPTAMPTMPQMIVMMAKRRTTVSL